MMPTISLTTENNWITRVHEVWYLPSIVHQPKLHKPVCTAATQQPTTRVRPVRIAAHRQRELMVIISKDSEWLPEEELDLQGLIIAQEDEQFSPPPLTINEHLHNPWCSA